MSCLFASFVLLLFIIAGVAVRPAQNFDSYDLDQTKAKEQDNLGGSRETMPVIEATLDGWHAWETDQKQNWASFDMVNGSVDELVPRDFDVQMRELQAASEAFGADVVKATEVLEKETKLHVEMMAAGSAGQDVVGTWQFEHRSRSATFSILRKGTQLFLTQDLDGKILESPLQASGEWWEGQGGVSIFGGGSDDAIRIRRRGDMLLINTKGAGDWQWRATVVAFGDGHVPASCNDIVGSDAEINLAAAKRCLDTAGLVHIQLPKGEFSIDETFVLQHHGTVLLQGQDDKAEAILKCSGSQPAFEFDDGAELLLEGIVLDGCGSRRSGAILAEGKDDISLRLQRGTVIRDSSGHGVLMRGNKNSRVVLEDDSIISGSGWNGFSAEEGENNMYVLRSSMLISSEKDGFYAEGGIRNALILENVTIKDSRKHGLAVYKGEKLTLSLSESAIDGSGQDGLAVNGGERHTFRLDHSTIKGSDRHGFSAYEGWNHTFSLGYSAIIDSRARGIYAYQGLNHTFSLGHSIINGSRRDGLQVRGGEKHTVRLGYSRITRSGTNGLGSTQGLGHTFILGYSTIDGSGKDGLISHQGKRHTFGLGGSTINDSGAKGLYAHGGRSHTFFLGYSTISGSAQCGLEAYQGRKHSFSLGRSSINRSGKDGLAVNGGKQHTFSLGFSTIDESRKNGLHAHVGSGHTFNLSHSTINGSGRSAIWTHQGEEHTFRLDECTFKGSTHSAIAVDGAGKTHTFSLLDSWIIGSSKAGIYAREGQNHTFSLGSSTINGSGTDGIRVREGEKHTVKLGDSTIMDSARHGIFIDLVSNSTLSLGSSTISGSGKDGLHSLGGEHNTFSLGYSTISNSGTYGLYETQGAEHTFSLGYSRIEGSKKDALASISGEAHAISLWSSTISGSGRHGLVESGGDNIKFSLGNSNFSGIVKDCFYAGGSTGSILVGGCTFEGCGAFAIGTFGREDGKLIVMNTNVQDSYTGLSIGQDSNVTLKDTTFWNISNEAVSSTKGLLYTENVSVYASGTAFNLGDVSWEGSKTNIMGNGNGITCTPATRGTLATSFVFLNGIHDAHDCNGLVLDVPLPTKIHAETLQAYVFIALLLVASLTVILPIIQDPPKNIRECSWLLASLSVAALAMWLATIVVVTWTVYELFKRQEHDETKYGVNAREWGMRFILLLVMGIVATIFAVIMAFLGRKKYTFLRSTAQAVLESEERRQGQHDLAQQRSEYTRKLREYHEVMVKNLSSATSCKSSAEGKQYLKAAEDHFHQMQNLAIHNGKELDSKMHRDVQQTYKDDPLRWQTLLDIESVSQKCRCQGEHMIPLFKIIAGDLRGITANELNEEATRRLILAASWGRGEFQKSLEKIAILLNNSEHVNDLINDLADEFPLVAEQLNTVLPDVRNLESQHKLLHDVNATLCGQHCNVMMGPNKTFQSASRKAATLHDEHKQKPPKDAINWQLPAARYMLDLLRATVVFSDPVTLVVYFHLLATEFTVISTKNKYKEPLEKVGSPSILVNIEINTILGKLTAEVQLYLDKFLDLKFLAHTNYEVERVRNLLELLSPFQH